MRRLRIDPHYEIRVGRQEGVDNFVKHGVTFLEAREVFYDPNALDEHDAGHSTAEARFFIIGLSSRRLLFVVYTEPEADVVRIISARRAVRTEREVYEQETIS